jgi:hypothetical protein
MASALMALHSSTNVADEKRRSFRVKLAYQYLHTQIASL